MLAYGWKEDDRFLIYNWERDKLELHIRLLAAKVIRKLNPGIIEEVEGCSCVVSDELDDELDKDMQSDEQ